MAIKKIDVSIQGITAILMHRFPMEPVKVPPELDTIENQAERAAYREEDTGELFVPGIALQRTMVNGATYSKGKGRATLQKPAAACLMVSPERVLLGTKEFKIDSRPVVMPSTRGRVVRHRPRIDDWKLSFELEYDDQLMSEVQVRQIVDDAGKRVGLLDFRPEKKGPFGRFIVTGWKAVKE